MTKTFKLHVFFSVYVFACMHKYLHISNVDKVELTLRPDATRSGANDCRKMQE